VNRLPRFGALTVEPMNAASPAPTERELFDAAISLPAEAVDAYLQENCPDQSLRARIGALLTSATAAEAAQLLPDEPAGWAPLRQEEQPGDLLGRFRLERIIGQGGFGVVWLARQQEPVQREVAVKILKAGLDTGAVVARFAAERQALAMMDHPNVAHVYDAGATASGRPYFVMEYLEGEPLFAYMAARRLKVTDRLALMLQAAAAVQHAHQKGIIHRDLKPSNIIVVEQDGRPVVKIIDFGIAKMVSAEAGADVTLAGQHWGTPAYMSPEQHAGEPLDTRTDVYSLGVILYELMAGVPALMPPASPEDTPLPPSRRVTRLPPDEMLTAAEQRSTTPRQLAGVLRGDLDWIVMKAVAAERGQRYDSAGALRDDLQRFLAGEAVSAGPPAAWYRAGKFIRRHRVKFAAAAAAVLALVAGTIVSLVYAQRAHQATLAMSAALYEARLTEARAVRQTGLPGQRLRALAAVAEAARLRPAPELRDEALAAMVLPDIAPVASLEVIPETGPVVDYDFTADLLVVGRQDSAEVLRYRLSTGEKLGPVPLPPRLTGSFKFCLSPGARILALYPNALFDRVSIGRSLTFYETASGRRICEVAGADFDSRGCEFLPDGRAIIPMERGGLSVVKVETGMEERRIETGGRIYEVRADAAGARLLACRHSPPAAMLIDFEGGTITRTFPVQGGSVANFSPDGRLAAFGDSSGKVRTVDLSAAGKGGRLPSAELSGHTSNVTSAEFVLGGQMVATTGWDNTVRLWNPGGRQLLMLDAGRAMIAPDGNRLLVWQGKRVQLFDLIASPECRVISQTEATTIARTEFSPDGNRVATTVSDGWLVSTWPELRPLARLSGRQHAMVFDPAGTRLFTSGDGLRAWPLATINTAAGTVQTATEKDSTLIAAGRIGPCTISADGRWLAVSAGHDTTERRLEIFSLPTCERVASLPWTAASVESIVFDPSGKWMAASWWRGKGFSVWDTGTWKSVALRETGVATLRLTVSQDGHWLASSSSSEICLWDTASWQAVRRFPVEPTSQFALPAAFAPQGGLLAFVIDPRRVRLLHAETGGVVAEFTLPCADRIGDLTFSPDGATLAVGTLARTWFLDLPRMQTHLQKLGLDFGP
jgi:WD40 repeat protein/predicted Ser/Thr protein kinase